jgi:MarR family transcriptional regulator, organic hydroperoxide resistance regulator
MDTSKIAAQISAIRTAINNFLLRELDSHGITGLAPSHGAILHHLFNNERVAMKDLAKAVRRDKSTVTALVAKLIASGYIEKVSSEDDQRSVLVRLTPKGEQLRPIFTEISKKLVSRVWQGIAVEDQQAVVRILEKIRSNL